MIGPAGSPAAENKSRVRAPGIWAGPVAAIVGIWLWVAFSSGGYLPHQWLPVGLAVGLFGLVVSLLAAYPRRPGQLASVVLALFGCYALWVAFSALWANSVTRVWMESGRTFVYLLVFALALIYFTDAAARRAFRYLLMAAALVILAVCVIRLWSAADISGLFVERMLAYPISYHNNAAVLFLIAFWPLMWVAAGPEERAPVRGVALGIVTGLLGLAVMTQSRGAIWSLAISTVFMFVVSPARLRTLLYLFVPAVLLVYQFPNLNRYWIDGPETVGGALGARTLLVSSMVAAGAGMILALLEKWIKVGRKARIILGTAVMVAVLAGAVYGAFALTSDSGGPLKWASRAWTRLTEQTGPQPDVPGTTRLTVVSLHGRVGIWQVAWEEFKQAPALGVGADNFAFEYTRLRVVASQQAQQAHSLELQVLGETGLVGAVLFAAAVLVALGGLLWPRCVAGWRGTVRRGESRWGNDSLVYGWEMALLAGLAYWLVHSSVDWVWQMPGVSIPALLLLAAALSSVDVRAGHFWRRIARSRPADSTERLQPPGTLSKVARWLLVALSAVVLIATGLPYISLQILDSAKGLAQTNPVGAVERAGAAHWLQPTSPDPFAAQAAIYESAAVNAASANSPDGAAAVLDNLALDVDRLKQAVAHEPADWSLHYQEGVATLDLLLARTYIAGGAPQLDYQQLLPQIPGLHDWSMLASSGNALPNPGVAAGSLAATGSLQQVVASYRKLSLSQLAQLALESLNAAQERNPLSGLTAKPIEVVHQMPY